jgi:BMFP domain-containing protein YqiC
MLRERFANLEQVVARTQRTGSALLAQLASFENSIKKS